MSGCLEAVILGCGSSGGVPRADGAWGACNPDDPRNRRSRCSLLVRRPGDGAETSLLVDTSPDLRLQTAFAGVRRLDAVLYSHDHADQAHGIDDLRAFALAMRRKIPCYTDAATRETLIRRFAYIFESQGGYPAICTLEALPAHGTPWAVGGPSGTIPVTSFEMDHGGVPAVGYRFAGLAYCSDVVRLPEAALRALQDLDVFIIDALRETPHPTHAHVALALEWIAELKPRRSILTNLHIDLDFDALSRKLPPGVEAAYDGLTLRVDVSD